MSNDRFDATLAAWIQAEAPRSAPVGLHARARDLVRARQAQPKWWSLRLRTRGLFPQAISPRVAYVALAVVLVLALLATLVVGAALLRRPTSEISNGAIAYTVGRAAVGGDQNGQDATFVNMAGAGLQKVTAIDGRPSNCASFSPDGSQLAWWSDDGEGGLMLVLGDATGENPETIPRAAVHSVFPAGGAPAWSPDGRHIAFAPWDDLDGGTSLVVVDVATKDVVVNPFGSPRVETPRWSPDGQHIAFVSDGRNLVVADADGENASTILTLDQLELASWSPDGQWLLFDAIPQTRSSSDVFLVRPDGTERRELSSSGLSDRFPVWSPDSLRVAYVEGDSFAGGASYAIHVVNVDGRKRRSIEPSAPIA